MNEQIRDVWYFVTLLHSNIEQGTGAGHYTRKAIEIGRYVTL